MAGGAIVLVKPRPQTVHRRSVGQAAGPGHVIGVEIEDAALRIGGLTTPFRAAVKAGKDDGLLPELQRAERAAMLERAELLQRPLMRLAAAGGQ